MRGNDFIRRGHVNQLCPKSLLCNGYKVAVCGCEETIRLFSVELDKDQTKKDFQLACRVCAWYATACLLRHVMLISRYRIPFLGAFDRDASGVKVPTSSILIRLSILRLGPENEENSTVDGGAPPRSSGWTGCGRPIEVSTGYSVREICDAQTLTRKMFGKSLWKSRMTPSVAENWMNRGKRCRGSYERSKGCRFFSKEMLESLMESLQHHLQDVEKKEERSHA